MLPRSFRFLVRISRENRRNYSVIQEKPLDNYKMYAWQVHSYGDDLLLSNARIPILQNVNDVLIKVEAASVNPIDIYMKDGYARTFLNVARQCEMELPLTLGRDFCGTIVLKGSATSDKYKIGDKVYGFVPLHKQGSFAEYVLARESHICHKPAHLNQTESTSLVYSTMTAWSALFITGGLQFQPAKNKRVLIIGASGGVGTAAVQLLKSQGVYVVGTCATDALPLVTSMGADEVFDYTQPEYLCKVGQKRFDIILDCAKFGVGNLPKYWKFKQFISLNSPLMLNTDEYGLIGGLVKSGSSLITDNILHLIDGKTVKWAFFVPSSRGFEFLNELITQKQIKPMLHKTFNFDSIPEAFNEVKKGHLRGKVVVNY